MWKIDDDPAAHSDRIWSMIRRRIYLSKYKPFSGLEKKELNRILKLYLRDEAAYAKKEKGLVIFNKGDKDGTD